VTECPKCGADWDAVHEALSDPDGEDYRLACWIIQNCKVCWRRFRHLTLGEASWLISMLERYDPQSELLRESVLLIPRWRFWREFDRLVRLRRDEQVLAVCEAERIIKGRR